MQDLSDDVNAGWWVPANDWFKQKLWSATGCWQRVRRENGVQLQACVLSGRDGWWDGNYEPVVDVAEWLKPAKWFDNPQDLVGKVAEWDAYLTAVFANRSALRRAA